MDKDGLIEMKFPERCTSVLYGFYGKERHIPLDKADDNKKAEEQDSNINAEAKASEQSKIRPDGEANVSRLQI